MRYHTQKKKPETKKSKIAYAYVNREKKRYYFPGDRDPDGRVFGEVPLGGPRWWATVWGIRLGGAVYGEDVWGIHRGDVENAKT